MASATLNALLEPVRTHGRALLAASDEPHAELLALVWGPQFDREHARALLATLPQAVPAVIQTVEQVALRFDGLPAGEQQRLRRLILRHHSRWDNAQAIS
jgi:hypothetical protein